jgi:hypothetical protein
MIEEHDIVVLTRDLPYEHLVAGDTGTVVLVHRGGKSRLRGGDGGDVGETGLHVQPRLAVGDMSARQALILLLMKNQMLHPAAPTARRRRPSGPPWG